MTEKEQPKEMDVSQEEWDEIQRRRREKDEKEEKKPEPKKEKRWRCRDCDADLGPANWDERRLTRAWPDGCVCGCVSAVIT